MNIPIPSRHKTHSDLYQGKTISEAMAALPLIDEVIARAFTPKNRDVILGEFFCVLPFLILFLPILYAPGLTIAAGFWIAFAVAVAMTTVIAVGLVIFGKKKAVEIAANIEKIIDAESKNDFVSVLTNTLSPTKQLILGSVFAISFVVGVLLQEVFYMLPPAIQIPVILAVGYIGLIWGSGLYIVFCIPEVLTSLIRCKFDITALYPYQQYELRKISEIISSLTLTGSWFATLLISILVALQFVIVFRFAFYLTGNFLFLTILEIILLLAALLILSLPFFSFHSFLSQVIKKAKAERIAKITTGMRKMIEQAENGQSDVIEQINKLQALIDQIDRSPDSVLASGTIGKFFSSIALTLLPVIIGSLLR